MELKEHLKLAFQTEVQLHVMENEVLPKWKEAENNIQQFKVRNDAAIKKEKDSVCQVETPQMLKTYAQNEVIEAENEKLKKFEMNNKPTVSIHYEEARNNYHFYRDKKEKISKYIANGILTGALLGGIPLGGVLYPMFANLLSDSGFSLGAFMMSISIVAVAGIMGAILGTRKYKKQIAQNKELCEKYENEYNKFNEYFSQYNKFKMQLKNERKTLIENKLKKSLETRDNAIEQFNKNKEKRLAELTEYGNQIDENVAYVSNYVKAMENYIIITKEALEKFYEAGFDGGKVHTRYRGLIPVGMFYEYIDTERCDTLAGHGGAYNMYEDDCRAARVEQKLDNINSNMFYIGQELKSAINQASYAIQGSMNFMGNQISTNISGLQSGIDSVRSISSGTNRLMENLSERGISVHGTLELKS